MSSLFRKEAVDNQKDNLMGDVLLLQPISIAILTSICILVTALIVALLFWGSYARKETVRGFLSPDQGIVKIYPTNTGSLSKIHVVEGQHVQAGDVLFTLAAERPMEAGQDVDQLLLKEIAQDVEDMEKRIVSEKGLEKTETQRLKIQIQGTKHELERIEEELALHQERVILSEKRIQGAKKLSDAKHMASSEYEKLYEEHLALRQHQQELQRTKVAKQNALAELQSQLQQLPTQVQSRVSDLQNRLSELRQKRFEIEGRRAFEIRSPIMGRVDALLSHEGEWLNSMQPTPLMALIPHESELLAELYVPTRAVGFLEVGQAVKLRYDAFPYQRYGTHSGRVASISHHILHPNELPVPLEIQEPVYRVVVHIDRQGIIAYGKDVPLQAGMSIEADIILEKQSLVRWLLDPLYSLKGRV